MKKTIAHNQPGIPVDIVLGPEWWHANTGITFDRDFFFHPLKRVEAEQEMEKTLYERWGRYGLGTEKDFPRPEVGAVHLAAGFKISEMMGCRVEYSENHPPQVLCANREELKLDVEDAFKSNVFIDFIEMCEAIETKYGYLTGDVNWGGILNIAMDLRGQQVFLDMAMEDRQLVPFFDNIFEVLSRFLGLMNRMTGSTSISVNRVVKHLDPQVLLHSECSHTMISTGDYEKYLMKYDLEWAKSNPPFGIHYCGSDPHRYAAQFANIPRLAFLDVGWGGDVTLLRQHLPNTFLNIRLSPVEIVKMSPDEIYNTATELIQQSGKDTNYYYLPHLVMYNL